MLATTLISLAAQAQNTENIFNQYLKVKDALVKSDSKTTSEQAVLLHKEIEASSTFSEKESLLKLVQKMTKTTDIEKQRAAFADVSTTMWKVVKNGKGIKQDVYYQYCPMKKMYWLSNEAKIKNPYYGSKMLTCGNVADKKMK